MSQLSYFLIVLATSLVTYAADWKTEDSSKILLNVLPKSRSSDQTKPVTVWDLGDKYKYPCVESNSAADETRSDLKDEDAILPRILWTHKFNDEIWACATKKDFERISKDHVRVSREFAVFMRERTGVTRTLTESSGIAGSYEVFEKKSALILQRNLAVTLTGKSRLVPFSEKAVACDSKSCETKEVCTLSAKGIDVQSELKKFDNLITKFKKMKGTHLEPPADFSLLLILAAKGNKDAANRIEKYPVYPGESGSVILSEYQSALAEARKLKCDL